MHRSGTSLLAQASSAAGIWAGAPDEMLAAQADNPAGFCEHRVLVRLNDALLAAGGGSWFDPPAQLAPPDGWRDAAAELVTALSAAGDGQLLLKDPRLALSWPAWAELLDDVLLLFVYRSPLAVARSLQRRNHFSLQFGLQLWEYYNRSALLALQQLPFLAVSFDRLQETPGGLESLLQSLAESGFRCEPGRAAQVLDRKLLHASQPDDPMSDLLTPQQRELSTLCAAVCEGIAAPEPGPLAPAALAACRRRLHDAAAVLAPLATVRETRQRLDETQALCHERTAERDRALDSLQRLEGDHAQLVAAHEAEICRHAAAAESLQALQDEHAGLAVAHRREVDSHGALQRAHRDLVALHERLHAEMSALQASKEALERKAAAEKAQLEREAAAEKARLDAEIASLTEKAEYLFFALTAVYRALLSFEHSTLARLQRQLRRVYRVLTLRRGRNSRYEDLLEWAHRHFDEYGMERPEPPPNKLRLMRAVIAYMLRNPAGSLRSLSWPRLRRALRLFYGKSPGDLATWVEARFPAAEDAGSGFDPQALDPSLDSLELDFPQSAQPRLSIIVPVYNDYRMTVNCLRSIHEHSAGIDYEIVIADDCSTDRTRSIDERMHGLRVARTTENLRFLRNCNQAAGAARGELLLFLNNDTAVTAGWLQELLRPFDDPRVGVVGPKLLFADGRLQEAGGIMWKDASAWNFGRGDDPSKPAYNYRRDVDYVSGACLMLRRSLWETLGGFDERFAPAYYEDADLCFAAREAGWRVVYQPRAQIYHFEGVSNGTDLASGVKQHQRVNQGVFRDKWQAQLEAGHFPNGERLVHARDRSRDRPCVLFIDHYVPHYDRDAGGRSTQMYVELLLRLGCRVQFMGANFFAHQPYTQRLQDLGVEVLVGESIARGLDGWLTEHAPFIDEIFLHRPHVAEQFLPHLERMRPRPPVSYFGHDLHYLRFAREAALRDDEALRRESASWRRRELAVCRRVERVYYFSDIEIEELRPQLEGGMLRCTPLYAVDFAALPSYDPDEPHSLLFVGGYNHPPNVDAAVWLARDILPPLREQVPQAHLHLVGSHPSEEVLALAGPGITVHGYVSDAELAALYRSVAVAVVPLRYGAGVKGKVIEAVSHNVPVLTTDIGAEGMPQAEQVMWIENTATATARRLAQLLVDDAARREKMACYAAWLQRHFAAERAAAVLAADSPALRRLAGGRSCAN